jgi:hypothetical protein
MTHVAAAWTACHAGLMVMMMACVRRRTGTGRIASECVVGFDLLRRQEAFHLDVGSQMDETQLALQLCDLSGQALEGVRLGHLRRKQLIQLLLLVDDESPEAHCLLVHVIVNLLRLSALRLGKR